MPSYDEYQAAEPDQQFLQNVVAPPPAAPPAAAAGPISSMAVQSGYTPTPNNATFYQGYDPGFGVGAKNFDTQIKDIGQSMLYKWTAPSLISDMYKANPAFFAGVDQDMLQNYIATIDAERPEQERLYSEYLNAPPQHDNYVEVVNPGEGFTAAPKEIQDLMSGLSLQRRGVHGLEDGRSNVVVDNQGNVVYAGNPYHYDPSGDTLSTLLEAASLASAAFGLVGAPLFGGITGGLNAAFAPTLGATGANMATQALVQGTLGGASSSARGGSFGEGFGRGALTGAITGGVSPYISQFGDTINTTVGGDLGRAASGAFTGAARSGIGALTSGTSVGDALLSGGIGGGVTSGMNALGGDYLSSLPPSVRNAVTSAISAGVLGRDPSQAAVNQFIGSLSLPSGTQPSAQAAAPAYDYPGGANLADFPSQEMQITPENMASFQTSLQNTMQNQGGFTSQWQTVGSDRVLVNDDGSAIGINTETGQTYALSPDETQRMVTSGLLNTPQSGYDAAISGTPATSGARPPASGTAPRAPSAAAPGASGASAATSQRSGSRGNGPSLEELIALLGGGEGTNAAQIATRSPYGNEIYGMRFGNV